MKNLPFYLFGLFLVAALSCAKYADENNPNKMSLSEAMVEYNDIEEPPSNKSLGNFCEYWPCQNIKLYRVELSAPPYLAIFDYEPNGINAGNFYLTMNCNQNDPTQATYWNGQAVTITPIFNGTVDGFMTTFVNGTGAIWKKYYYPSTPPPISVTPMFSQMHNFESGLNNCNAGLWASVNINGNVISSQTQLTAFSAAISGVQWLYQGQVISTQPKLGLSGVQYIEDFDIYNTFTCSNSLLVSASSGNLTPNNCDCGYNLTLRLLVGGVWYETTQNTCIVIQGIAPCAE